MGKPIIGITCKYREGENFLQEEYSKGIMESGGIPFLIPMMKGEGLLETVLTKIDGLMLSGGEDVSPEWYGEEPKEVGEITPQKDELEIPLVKLASQKGMPILGICRGLQVINVAMGGKLLQHITGGIKHFQKAPKNCVTHKIKIVKNTFLWKVLAKENVMVNSFHHQAIKELGCGLRAAAIAGDGIIEAIEGEGSSFLVGVQFHIEYLWQERKEFRKLFEEFVNRCKK